MPAAGVDAVWMHFSEARRDDLLYLGDRDHRELLDEQQEPHREPTEAAAENRVVDPRRAVTGPLPRLELVRQRWHDDDESLEPHADVDRERDDEQPRRIAPQLLHEE